MSELKYVPGRGPIGAKLMVIGECPTPQDTDAGMPFTGAVGRELDYILRDAGIYRPNCWTTNVSKYHVPPNLPGQKIPFTIRAKNLGIDIDTQLKELQVEINDVNPNCILALGGSALWALTGKGKIGSHRGSILHGMGHKLVPTYKPNDLLHHALGSEFIGYWNRQIMVVDAKRALAQSQFPDMRLPIRTIEICRNSAQLAEYRKRYKGKIKMAVDIEANGTCVPVCIGFAHSKGHAIVVPLWNVGGISTIPDSDMVQIWIIVAEMLHEFDIVGQNFNYDRDKILRLGFSIRRLADDTMLKAMAINPELPKGLGFNTSIYTEEPFYKDEGMYEGSIEDLFKGCGKDACVTFEINEAMNADVDELGMRSFYKNFLMKLPEFYWGIERQGFRVDPDERDRLLHKYIEWDERIRHELFTLVGAEVNVNSHVQVKVLLFDNFGLPRRDSSGEEDITALLNSPTAIKSDTHRRVCELILEGRRVRKSISTYLMALPDYDGRMRTTYFPCLDTGRTSTGQQDPPIRPSIEIRDYDGKKKNKVCGTAFQTMTKHGDIGADIRGMYVPDICHIEIGPDDKITIIEEEEIFIQADSSQAEARVVALLAMDEKTLAMYDSNDIHALTASWFFGGSESDYSKKVLGYEHPIRFAGKTLRHAGHLGAGKRRAAIELNTQARKYKIPIQVNETITERALQIFHAKSPRIQQVFQAQVIEAVKRNRRLVAPLPYGVAAAIGGQRTFFERMGDELYRQAFSYIPQRAVSDNTKAAGMRIKAKIPTIKIVMESHDALLFSVPISKKVSWGQIIKEEMERPIDFSRCSLPRHELSIPCDLEVGYNYRDLSKFRDLPIVAAPMQIPTLPPKSVTEQFLAPQLADESHITNAIYEHQMRRLDG